MCTAFADGAFSVKSETVAADLDTHAFASVLVAAFQCVVFLLAENVEVIGGGKRHVLTIDLAGDEV